MACGGPWPCWHFHLGLLASGTETTWLLFSDTQFIVLCHGNPRETNSAGLVDYHPLPAPPVWFHLWPWIFFFKHISLGDQLELGCESKLAAVPAIWEANESTDLEKIIYHLQAPVSSSVNWGQWYLPLRFPITPCCSLSWGINTSSWDLPGGPVAKTPCSQYRSPEFDSWSGN